MKFLLVTDLDNTLVGDAEATLALNQRLLALGEQVCLVYATGRSFASFGELSAEFLATTGQPLLSPDYLIAGVGSEIYHQNQRDSAWAARLSANWQRQRIADLLAGLPELVLQPTPEQNPWKLSYFVKPQIPSKQSSETQLVEQLLQLLASQGLNAEVIFSSNRDLDILPSQANKGTAMAYLQNKLGIGAKATLVCGDSGNDISLFAQGTLGVIVSNAQPELLDWHRQNRFPQHYWARSAYAAGINEALDFFHLA